MGHFYSSRNKFSLVTSRAAVPSSLSDHWDYLDFSRKGGVFKRKLARHTHAHVIDRIAIATSHTSIRSRYTSIVLFLVRQGMRYPRSDVTISFWICIRSTFFQPHEQLSNGLCTFSLIISTGVCDARVRYSNKATVILKSDLSSTERFFSGVHSLFFSGDPAPQSPHFRFTVLLPLLT